jgi:hypothetical protein
MALTWYATAFVGVGAMLAYQRIRASGRFSLPGGHLIPHEDVSVEIEQLGSGSTFVYFKGGPPDLSFMANFGRVKSFVGFTDDGLPIQTSDLRIYFGSKADRECYSVSHAIIGDPAATYSSVELALTNLVFERGSKQRRSFIVTVGGAPLSMELVPMENYDDLVFHMRQTDCPIVTIKLRITTDSLSIDTLDSLTNDLCTTLSIIQGRKIQWIQRTAYAVH